MPAARFSSDDGFDFAVRCLLNGAAYGMADVGEVLATAAGIPAGDASAWFDAWTELGARSEATAARGAEGGHERSACEAYLRAANYRFAGFYYVLASAQPERHLDAWRAHRAALEASLARWPLPVERLAVPAAPAWLFRATPSDDPTPRPLLVVHDGLGSPLSDVVMTGVADATARGWHAVAFDGPGQGSTWFEDGVGPVDDWAPVGAAVLDAALAQPGVDADRVALCGISDGGYLAAVAAADPRVRALVCDPGVVAPVEGALGQLSDHLQQRWRSGDHDAFRTELAAAVAGDADLAFTAAKLTEQWPTDDVAEVLGRLSSWQLDPSRITCPTFVADPEEAMSFPGQSARLVDALGSRATLAPFTTAEGAGLDCEILAPRLRAQRIFDWLDDQLGPGQPETHGRTHP